MTDAMPLTKGRSKLVPAGVLLMLLGVGVPMIVQRLLPADQPMGLTLALVTDGFRLGFFVGIALLIIGWMRNKRSNKKVEPKA